MTTYVIQSFCGHKWVKQINMVDWTYEECDSVDEARQFDFWTTAQGIILCMDIEKSHEVRPYFGQKRLL